MVRGDVPRSYHVNWKVIRSCISNPNTAIERQMHKTLPGNDWVQFEKQFTAIAKVVIEARALRSSGGRDAVPTSPR